MKKKTEKDDIVGKKSGAYFPLGYVTDMLSFFTANKDKINLITYKDIFSGIDDSDYAGSYPTEKRNWLGRLKEDKELASKAHILIQYDLDSRPERAMRLLSHDSHKEVPANVMRFFKRVDRRKLKTSNELSYTDYPLDNDLLSELEKNGSVIGYHSNCYERSHHNYELAQKKMKSDIEALSQLHNIEFYTAHGGVPCSEGKNNRDIHPLSEVSETIRWVHNGATPFFDKQFSDGGHNSPLRDPSKRDVRDFISAIKPGGRYRILLHPQYYDSHFTGSKRYVEAQWYRNMIKNYQDSDTYNSWDTVHLTNFGNNQHFSKNSQRLEGLSEENGQIYKIYKKIYGLFKAKG